MLYYTWHRKEKWLPNLNGGFFSAYFELNFSHFSATFCLSIMLFFNHRFCTAVWMFLLAFFIAIPTFTITSTTAYAADDSEYDSDACLNKQGFLCGRNAECTMPFGSDYKCDVVSGCCYMDDSSSCSCPSGYSGTCEKNDSNFCAVNRGLCLFVLYFLWPIRL